ncbi:helix-turn-helix transcriptional regulator [Gracilibacillus phocaeensis]|uniref:helix-turn-helix transcriptional regulator n=1 Tax=Gracilibacillus phocaeensis TaxID=2042304 RepID=UPI00102F7702|nr:helix-turn-helix domain-containing protein [Gracilibacillus phocaeensis]
MVVYTYSNRTNELNHNLVVIDQQNRIIAQPNNQLELDGDVLMENFTEDSPSSSQITIDDQTYMINLEQSNTYGLKFVNLTPIDEILSEITQLKVKTLLLVGLIFLIEVGLIILLIRVNYHPIKKLRQSALHSVEEELFSDLTEYEVVSYAFDNLQKRNKELVSKEMLNKNISQEYFFIQHLNKTVESNESIIQHAAEQGIQLGDKVCCITFFSMNRNIIELLSLLEEIMAQSHDDQLIFSYRVKGVRHEDFILVLSFTQEDQIKPFIYRIHEMKKDVNIGIGTVEEMRLLSYSYTHSLAALEVATLHHDIHIMSYYDIDVKNANEISKLFEIINLIELSITRKDDAQLRLQLNNLISLMKNDISRIFILNIIFTNTYNVLVKALNKFGSKEEYCYVVPEKDLNIKELEDRLLEKGEQVIEYIMKEGSKTTKVEIALILQFIDTHYMDETISLQLLADEFNMSYSNLSRFFKKQVGKSFVSYIENIRMTEAKRLLRESEQAIQVIARQVGYSNANSFTRLFKKTEGITPGMYRNLYNEKKGGGLG